MKFKIEVEVESEGFNAVGAAQWLLQYVVREAEEKRWINIKARLYGPPPQEEFVLLKEI